MGSLGEVQFWLLFGERMGHRGAWIALLGAGLPQRHTRTHLTGAEGGEQSPSWVSLKATHPLLPTRAAWPGTPQAHSCPCMWVTGSLTVRASGAQAHLWGSRWQSTAPERGTKAQPHRQLGVGCGWRAFPMRALGWGCRRPPAGGSPRTVSLSASHHQIEHRKEGNGPTRGRQSGIMN